MEQSNFDFEVLVLVVAIAVMESVLYSCVCMYCSIWHSQTARQTDRQLVSQPRSGRPLLMMSYVLQVTATEYEVEYTLSIEYAP